MEILITLLIIGGFGTLLMLAFCAACVFRSIGTETKDESGQKEPPMPLPVPHGCWQDVDRTIPATKPGDPVAVIDNQGSEVSLVQVHPELRPVIT